MKKLIKVGLLLMTAVMLITGCQDSGKEEKATGEIKESKAITVGTEGKMPPWTYVENDKLTGFEIEMWEEIGKRIGYEVKFEQMKFTSLFGLLDSGKIDTIAEQISITEDRKVKYDFSSIYVYNKILLVTSPKSGINSIEEIDGKSVCVEPNSNDVDVVDAIEEKNDIKLKREYYDGISIKDVELGRVDLWIKAESSAREVIKQIGEDKLKIAGETPVIEENAYPFRKDERSQELRKLTSQAIDDMRKDGTIKKLSEKYFEIDVTQKPE